jgi:hypothetical protein
MTMTSAENTEFSQDNRGGTCKRAHQGLKSSCAKRWGPSGGNKSDARPMWTKRLWRYPGEVGALIDRGYLAPKDRHNLEVLAAAVTAFFSDALVTP